MLNLTSSENQFLSETLKIGTFGSAGGTKNINAEDNKMITPFKSSISSLGLQILKSGIDTFFSS